MAQHITTFSLNVLDTGTSIHRTNPLPLDSTLNWNSKSNLETYAKDGKTSYVGLLVNHIDGSSVLGTYIIKNQVGTLTELASVDYVDNSIKNLGPVFSFKGVGTYIDPDLTTITLGSGHISGTVGVIDNPVFGCYGTQYGSTDRGETFTMMYGWGNSAELFFWTKEMLTLDNKNSIILYTRSAEESQSQEYIEIGEDRYFAAMRNNEIKSIVWKNTSGDTLYTYTNDTDSSKVDVYATSSKSNPLAIGVDVKTFNYYNFTEIPTQYTLVLDTDIKVETASKDNNGDVYQIEEEEYASNGNMWVLLGSPKNKWIVL